MTSRDDADISNAELPLDSERALELDALAEQILRRRVIAPKTLVGLGAPQPPAELPSEPPSNSPSADAPASDLHVTQQQPAFTDLGATQKHAFRPLVETPRETAATSLELDATQRHAPESFGTIAPPPPDDAAELELRTLPTTRRYETVPDSARDVSVSPQSDAPWALPPSVRREPQLGSRLLLIGLAFAASLAATLLLVNSLLPSRKGNLLVTASGPNQVRIEQAEVLLDGKHVCAQVPCRLEALSAGTHAVSVWATGYERMAAQPIVIRGGVDSALQLTLARRNTAALRISTNVPGLSVRLDGEDRGPAPTTLHQLSPVEHSVRLQGNPAYAPFEQRVVLEADHTTTLEPQLRALRTVLHLESGTGAEDARIELIRGDERREIRKLPADVELTPGAPYRLHASRRNFEDYDSEIAFDEGHAERSIVIALSPREHRAADVSAAAALAPLPARAPLATGAAVPSGTGTLNINSIPISNVLLDGRPVGATPQKLNLNAGPHSLVFIHPTLGRQERSVRVAPGQTAVAAVRF